MSAVKVPPHVQEVVRAASVDGDLLILTGALDRKTYTDVDKVLKLAGGAWNRKRGGHVFPNGASAAVAAILGDDGLRNKKKDLQQFHTPPAVVDALIRLADLPKDGYTFLEPSAGDGAILRRLPPGAVVTAIELDGVHDIALRSLTKWQECPQDFLTWETDCRFDRIVMNPPFSNFQDVRHVTHALRFLASGGILVAVMGKSWTFSHRKEAVAFHELVIEWDAKVVDVEPGAFKQSGTDIATLIVVFKSPGGQG